MKRNLLALLCGTLFGIGLAVSGMTDTNKVIGFLDIFGQWVPDLAFVMAGAVLVSSLGYLFMRKRTNSLFAGRLLLPVNTNIDRRLLLGAAIFGIGWGLYGYCPGPAIAALAYLDKNAFIFVLAMFAGMWLSSKLSRGN